MLLRLHDSPLFLSITIYILYISKIDISKITKLVRECLMIGLDCIAWSEIQLIVLEKAGSWFIHAGLVRISECSGIQSILDWMDDWLL